MSATELAWLAGLVEGEGCFYLSPDRRHLRLKVSMSDEDVIERVCVLMGASRARGYAPSNPRDKRDRSKMFEASLSGHQAAEMMQALLPWMGRRRSSKIHEVLAGWEPSLRGKGHCPACATWVRNRAC